MTLTVAQLRAIPLLVLGAGVFVLAATYEMPADMAGPAIDIPALHDAAYALGPDPSACADSASADCAIDAPAGRVLAAGP